MKINNCLLKITLIGMVSIFVSCSSSPKRAMLVTEISANAATIYETANNELISGELANAGFHLQKAYNLALSVDNSDLLCRISLSAIIWRLSYNSSSGKTSENPDLIPFEGFSAEDLLLQAKLYAERSENYSVLSAVVSIYEVRVKLAQGQKINVATEVQNLDNCAVRLKKEPYYTAFLYRTEGDVYASEKLYSEAENAYNQAALIHKKNRYLSEIGLDYYCAARVLSLNGQKEKALEAIDTALKFDKDAENTAAIAADYYAYGLIPAKEPCSPENKKKAKNVIIWASKVYKAGSFEEEAAQCLKTADSL